jgi:hypothetical protein
MFQFNSLSDQIHSEVQEDVSGPNDSIEGNIILKSGFIETYFEYIYYKGTINKRFEIEINSQTNNLYPNSKTKVISGTNYGISEIDIGTIKLNY